MASGSSVEAGETSFGRLYRQEAERLWRAVFAFAGDREVANDAVAEAFAQCLRRGDDVRDPRAWVWRAAFAIARGDLKERRRRIALADLEDAAARDPDLGRVLLPLARLAPRQRAVLLLRFYAGYSSREVAQLLGMAPATVRVHLARGRRNLQRLLEIDDSEVDDDEPRT